MFYTLKTKVKPSRSLPSLFTWDSSSLPLSEYVCVCFTSADRWEVEALAAKLEISDDILLKHVSVWINHGLLTFSADRKMLIATSSFQDTRYDGDGLMEEMETAVSSDAQEAEDLKMLETYIVGMLSNFGSLPIQRIHNMLSTFARSGAQPCKCRCFFVFWRYPFVLSVVV